MNLTFTNVRLTTLGEYYVVGTCQPPAQGEKEPALSLPLIKSPPRRKRKLYKRLRYAVPAVSLFILGALGLGDRLPSSVKQGAEEAWRNAQSFVKGEESETRPLFSKESLETMRSDYVQAADQLLSRASQDENFQYAYLKQGSGETSSMTLIYANIPDDQGEMTYVTDKGQIIHSVGEITDTPQQFIFGAATELPQIPRDEMVNQTEPSAPHTTIETIQFMILDSGEHQGEPIQLWEMDLYEGTSETPTDTLQTMLMADGQTYFHVHSPQGEEDSFYQLTPEEMVLVVRGGKVIDEDLGESLASLTSSPEQSEDWESLLAQANSDAAFARFSQLRMTKWLHGLPDMSAAEQA